MDAPIVGTSSRTVMFALSGRHEGPSGDAEEAEGAVMSVGERKTSAGNLPLLQFKITVGRKSGVTPIAGVCAG
jgi:hypothetical protein